MCYNIVSKWNKKHGMVKMEIKVLGLRVYVRKSVFIIFVTFIFILAGIVFESFAYKNEDITFSDKDNINKDTPVSTPQNISVTPSPQNGEDIKIYLSGCVKNPGIVTVKKGQIIEDALNMAGGITEDADLEKINRVYRLKENVMIYVKSKNEQQKQADQSVENSWKQANDAGPGIEIISDSGGSILGAGQNGGTQKKVNLNSATEAEFDTLPGIGKETAKTIIEYRDKNGGFKDIKDIMKIPGIKESRFNSIKDLISVD